MNDQRVKYGLREPELGRKIPQSHIFVGNAGFMTTTAAVAARQVRSLRDRIMSRLVGGQDRRRGFF